MIFRSAKWLSFLRNPDNVLLAAIIWFVFPFVILGKFSYIYSGDNLEILVTHLTYLGNTGPGSWGSHSTAGMDIASLGFVGFINSAVFSLFPGWLAYQVLIVVQTVGAIAGSYYLCQRSFGLSKAASLLPALIYGVMLSGQLVFSVYSLLPALLLSLTLLLDRPQKAGAWAFALAMVVWIAGTAYMSRLLLFPSLLLVAWFLFVDGRRRLWQWALILAAAILLQALRAGDVLALMQNAPLSHIKLLRSLPQVSDIFALPSVLQSTIGLLCLGLFGLAWLTAKSRPGPMRGVGILLILGLFAEPIFLALQLMLSDLMPLIQGFQVSRTALIFDTILWLSSAYGAAFVIDNFAAGGKSRMLARLTLAAVALSLAYLAVLQKTQQAYDWIVDGNFVANMQSPALRSLAAQMSPSPWPQRAEPFQINPTYLHPYGIETAGGYQALYLRRYYEFWSTIIEPWGASGLDRVGVGKYDTWPFYRSTRLRLTSVSHFPERRLGDLFRLNLLSMANVGWIIARDKLTDPSLVLLRGPQQPWSSLSQKQKLLANLKANFVGREHVYIYRNPSALPRFFSPTRIRVHPTGRAVLAAMAESEITELSEVLHMAAADLPPEIDPAKTYSPLSIHPVAYGNDRIELRVEAQDDGLLIGMNAWSPLWSVSIDGEPGQLFAADHAFWGVRVAKGSHRVEFRYNAKDRLVDRI